MTGKAGGLGPLHGVKIVEASMLGPGAITTHLADLGADVIKVEPPKGDYLRDVTWPIVEGVSLMHLHIGRGKRSVVLDLSTPEGVSQFLELVKEADVVVEAMRPGGLARRGLTFERLLEVNPSVVFCSISGFGSDGPYRDLPSHGVAFDAWAGIFEPELSEDHNYVIPEHASIGIHAGPLYGAIGILAGVIRARQTGEPSNIEIAQSDAAAAMDWLRSETWRAYERPESEVTGNAADGYERRPPGTAGMRSGVRYQIYESSDSFILFMAAEMVLWKRFCEGVDRLDLFDRFPGSQYGDHASGNTAMQRELKAIFATRTTADWLKFATKNNVPIGPVNTPKTIGDDPQFKARTGWLPKDRLGAEQLPTPIRFVGEELPLPTKSPTLGEHSEEILARIDREKGTIQD